MKKNEKREMLDEFMAEHDVITTQQLMNFKVSPQLIQEWIQNEVLVRVTRGVYQLGNIDNEEDDIAYQEFQQALKEEDYQKAVAYLLKLKQIPKENELSYHLELILLNRFFHLPLELQTQIQALSKNNYLLSSYKEKEDYKIGLFILSSEHSKALQKLKQKCKNAGTVLMNDEIMMKLLKKTIEQETLDFQTEIQYEQDEKFQELEEFLNQKKEIQALSLEEKSALFLVQNLLKGQASKVKINYFTKEETLYGAISNYDYFLARKLISLEQNRKSQNLLEPLLDALIALDEQQKETEQKQKKILANALLPQVFSCLLSGQQKEFSSKLNEFLSLKEKNSLLPIVQNLVKISVLEEDLCFQKPLEMLLLVNQDNYQYKKMKRLNLLKN